MNRIEARKAAEQAALQSYLNCYIRETGMGRFTEDAPSELANVHSGKWLHLPLKKRQEDLYIPAVYVSETGRHLFHAVYYQSEKMDFLAFAEKTLDELNTGEQDGKKKDLLKRISQSYTLMAEFIYERSADEEELYKTDFQFLEAEQALLFGHLLHPAPKSREGMNDEDIRTYSPELKGAFPLHYFRVPADLVYSKSLLPYSAIQQIKKMVNDDPEISEALKSKYAQEDGYALLPLHPWQAHYVLQDAEIRKLADQGILENLGQHGRSYFATSSLRTVYHPDVPFMLKFSLNIKITNSVRTNLMKELERGAEVKELMETRLGQEMADKFPNFGFVHDPAFLTLKLPDRNESGFEVILRENPFYGGKANQAAAVVSLCQGGLKRGLSRLSSVIRKMAAEENRPTNAVSEDWLKKYLAISMKPVLWLYLEKGIALEAHQQNSIVKLKGGYPERFYYRDNQGFYFCESKKEILESYLAGAGKRSETVCSDAVADERLSYYFFFNHLFGLVNAFGTAGLADERKLLKIIREELESCSVPNGHPSQLIKNFLEKEELPCKANLMTGYHDLDELVGPLETQSVYVNVPNPLFSKEAVASL
ncbi:IucA/IucC family protein [Metabacillus sp. JX24]|uniref:IucA/IucC family protein n=1 Tax=Metabacillus sp. JX24 TaxID=3240759 RepID=UPI003510A660